jgi:hypothetical protein
MSRSQPAYIRTLIPLVKLTACEIFSRIASCLFNSKALTAASGVVRMTAHRTLPRQAERIPPRELDSTRSKVVLGTGESDWRSSAYNDIRPPVWLGSARGPLSPLWLPLPCSQKRRASVVRAPIYRHNKFPTARAFGESLAASRRTNSQPGQILHSCIIRWRWGC